MKKASTIILRLALLAMAVVMLGICFGIGWTVNAEGRSNSEYSYVGIILLIGTCSAAVPFFITLFQSAKLLSIIDRGRVFSEQSINALSAIIRSTLVVFAVCTIGGLPFFYMIAEMDEAPGVIFLGMAISGIVFAIAMFAYVLRWLLKEAIGYKERCAT